MIMIDWNKRNGGFLSPESVYEDQLGNLSMQINQKDKEIERLTNIVNKIEDMLQSPWNIECVNQNNAFLQRIKELKEGVNND